MQEQLTLISSSSSSSLFISTLTLTIDKATHLQTEQKPQQAIKRSLFKK